MGCIVYFIGKDVGEVAKRKLKKSALAGLLVIAALVIAAVCGWGYISPGTVDLSGPVTVNIASGMGTKAVAARLAEAGVVKNAASFSFYVRGEGADGDLRPGSYTFEGEVDYAAVLAELLRGGVAENTKNVTVPEGKTVPQVAAIWEEAGLCTAEEFLTACAEADLPYDYIPAESPDDRPYDRLEGFLFPETYNVLLTWGAEDLVELQVGQFDKIWTDERREQAAALGDDYDAHKVLTVASLIEREAKVDAERPLIASVIYNRLAIGQLLQIDATIQYILGEQADRVLYKHLEIDDPYNTYMYEGLPPGPICSPGAACIDAALNPAETEYYYYRTKNDGSGEHNFARTFAEHQAYGAA